MSTASHPSPNEAPAEPRAASNRAVRRLPTMHVLVLCAALAAVALSVHVWSLWDGTVLDDYEHQRGLRENGWSYHELMRTLVIEPASWVHAWWQDQPVRWEYGRPLFILSMKVVYHVLGGDDPAALHLFSIVTHILSTWMIAWLAWRITAGRWWAPLAGVLFAIYPHAVITVAWPSSQNIVTSTALLLAALICYWRAADLGFLSQPPREPIARLRVGPTVAMFAAWIAALLTRENALLLPVVLVALEWSLGGRRRVWARRGAFAAFAIIGAAFIAWRIAAVAGGLPPVYSRRPEGDLLEYGLWCVAKLLHYLCTSIWLAPMTIGPTGRYNPWLEAPGDCLLMLLIVAAIGGGYLRFTRAVRGAWLWPLWILLAVLPVTPVVAAPHSGYLCGVGVSLGAAVAGAHAARRRGAARRVAHGVLAFYVIGFALFSMWSRWIWTGVIAAERYALAWIEADPPPRTATDVFFINLPFVNIYNKPALVERLGPWFRDVNCHILAWAPDPFVIDDPVTVEQLDARSFAVSGEGQPFFSRLLGRFLIEAFRAEGPFASGDVIRGDAFDVRIDRGDERGVERMTFTFQKPLADPSYCFYVSTAECGATRLRFGRPANAAGDAALYTTIRAELERASSPANADAALPDESLAVVRTLAADTASPVARLLRGPRPSPDQWRRVAQWWRRDVDAALVDLHWNRRHEFDRFIKQREEVPHARMWAGKVFRTDLYLTGPPFPGPRR